jgi:hypothetical protein
MNLRGVWGRIGIRPWRLLVVVLVIVFATMGFSHLLYPCSPDERAVLTEFSQYGGKEVTDEALHRSPNDPLIWVRWAVAPHPQEGWGCFATYSKATGTREEHLAYYRRQLEERGWEVGPVRSERGSGGNCCQEFYAYRDGYRYWVYVDPVYLLVEVTRVGVPRPGWL